MKKITPAIAAAFELGYRCHERGMNLQAAMSHLGELYSDKPMVQCRVCKKWLVSDSKSYVPLHKSHKPGESAFACQGSQTYEA